MPSPQDGVQTTEISGSPEENRALNEEWIAQDLMRRDGVTKESVPPGMYEAKAREILNKLEQGVSYENAIDQVENEHRRNAPEGGRELGPQDRLHS